MNATVTKTGSLVIGGNAAPYLMVSGIVRGEVHG